MLDKYSEDAKRRIKISNHLKRITETNTSKGEKTKNNTTKASNPQLPTKKELEHKTTPAQSFEDDFKQK